MVFVKTVEGDVWLCNVCRSLWLLLLLLRLLLFLFLLLGNRLLNCNWLCNWLFCFLNLLNGNLLFFESRCSAYRLEDLLFQDRQSEALFVTVSDGTFRDRGIFVVTSKLDRASFFCTIHQYGGSKLNAEVSTVLGQDLKVLFLRHIHIAEFNRTICYVLICLDLTPLFS